MIVIALVAIALVSIALVVFALVVIALVVVALIVIALVVVALVVVALDVVALDVIDLVVVALIVIALEVIALVVVALVVIVLVVAVVEISRGPPLPPLSRVYRLLDGQSRVIPLWGSSSLCCRFPRTISTTPIFWGEFRCQFLLTPKLTHQCSFLIFWKNWKKSPMQLNFENGAQTKSIW